MLRSSLSLQTFIFGQFCLPYGRVPIWQRIDPNKMAFIKQYVALVLVWTTSNPEALFDVLRGTTTKKKKGISETELSDFLIGKLTK